MVTDETFELVDVALQSEELGRLTVPLSAPAPGPFELPEGAVVSVALTFHLREAVDGLCFVDTRRREGRVVARTRTALGSFRPGGPYEILLPAERLPVGRAECGTYEVTGTFVDAEGRELSQESHRFRIVHQPRILHRRHHSPQEHPYEEHPHHEHESLEQPLEKPNA
ncbi:hypothetical protein [Streptomyces sp. NPDC048603]|uniref:hypothetical protein n=1 Tax=Streptomyces sp. NPDC048603 TaxID=3365577 RepID=UPI00371CF3E7